MSAWQERRLKLIAFADPVHPNAWREPEVMRWLNKLVANGCEVVLLSETTPRP